MVRRYYNFVLTTIIIILLLSFLPSNQVVYAYSLQENNDDRSVTIGSNVDLRPIPIGLSLDQFGECGIGAWMVEGYGCCPIREECVPEPEPPVEPPCSPGPNGEEQTRLALPGGGWSKCFVPYGDQDPFGFGDPCLTEACIRAPVPGDGTMPPLHPDKVQEIFEDWLVRTTFKWIKNKIPYLGDVEFGREAAEDLERSLRR
ncbi:MAG: hypothetical protein WA941_11815 [Nitrososphaeraceae archaeon]